MQHIQLSGDWQFCLDPKQEGIEKQFYQKDLPDTICLPGTTAEAKKGERGQSREDGHLTELYHFEGYAWYAKTIVLPALAPQTAAVLTLERTRISHVWVDGRYAGKQESFCAAHVYDLTGFVHEGAQRITVLVDNVNYRVPGGHMTSPDTQTNWNGILGELSLNLYEGLYISQMRVFPEFAARRVSAEVTVAGPCARGAQGRLCVSLYKKGEQTQAPIAAAETEVTITGAEDLLRICVTIPQEQELLAWSEYTPQLYELRAELTAGAWRAEMAAALGFRDLATDQRCFYINGRQILLRGKQEALTFPLTGYAPTDKASWRKVFLTAKEYGLNHYRFHTCCPPEAAFAAADELGIYLEPEIPFWGTILSEDDPEYEQSGQSFLPEEGRAILDAFGNHPSFVLFSLGNELWGSGERLSRMLADFKAHDPRHWYTQGSNNFQFAPVIQNEDDFFCGVRFSRERLFRGSYAMCDAPQGHIQLAAPENQYTYDERIRPQNAGTAEDTAREIEIQYHTGVKKVRLDGQAELIPQIPVVSHEVGQYAMYPDFREIEKYTGVLRAVNFEIFRERLRDQGLLELSDAFFEASGKLAVQCYKREMEAAFRSRELAGFQILDLQDFPGQGTALVGVLNAFLESKGLIAPRQWRQFCSDRVLMLSFPRYVYKEGEAFAFELLLCNMSPEKLASGRALVRLCAKGDAGGQIWEKETGELTPSRLSHLGGGHIRLPKTGRPQIYDVSVSLEHTDIENHYEIYVYPEAKRINPGDVVVTKEKETLTEALRAGKRAVYFGKPKRGITGTYCTDFWCYPMFASISKQMGKEKPVGTLGMYIRAEHPALADFPADTFTTPQWWNIVENGEFAVLDGTDFTPVVWGIDNFARNHRLGLLYECRVGEGRLLVCHADLAGGDSAEEIWLYNSLLRYAESDAFAPAQSGTLSQIDALL